MTYHNDHSNAHETLGFAAGTSRLMLGGPEGREVRMRPGDVAVLPAGTVHRRLESSADLLVVGAYPPGQVWDIWHFASTGEIARRIFCLPVPRSDPVAGDGGILTSVWKAS